MPSPKLTPAQIAKKKKADQDFHSNPNKPTSADSIRAPKSLATIDSKLAALIDPSLEIVKELIEGKDIPKAKADTAKWVLLQAVAMKKTILDHRMQKLKLKLEELKVSPPDNIVAPPTTPTEYHDNVVDINKALTEYNPDWDKVEDFSYAEDPEEEVDNDT